MSLCSNRKKQVNVVYATKTSGLSCECHLFEYHGIPCGHTFVVFKNEYIDTILNRLICKQWTKFAERNIVLSDRLNEINSCHKRCTFCSNFCHC